MDVWDARLMSSSLGKVRHLVVDFASSFKQLRRTFILPAALFRKFDGGNLYVGSRLRNNIIIYQYNMDK